MADGYQIVAKDAPTAEELQEALESLPPDAIDVELIEGSLKLVSHMKRERAPGLAKKKKAAFRDKCGKLFCERCGLTPSDSYEPDVADACIEVHHAKTLVKDMAEGHLTSLDDLQCLCANCHRVTHREIARGMLR
jgi:5-methylcytosine-specific restriction protein A